MLLYAKSLSHCQADLDFASKLEALLKVCNCVWKQLLEQNKALFSWAPRCQVVHKKTSYSVQGCSDQFLSISAELFVQLCFNLFTPVFVAAVVVVVVVVAAVVAVAACLAETGTRLHSWKNVEKVKNVFELFFFDTSSAFLGSFPSRVAAATATTATVTTATAAATTTAGSQTPRRLQI